MNFRYHNSEHVGHRSESSKLHVALLCLIIILTPGCAGGPVSYDRHNLSRLWVPDTGDVFYFDAATTPVYPRDSESAEASRQEWIAEWLKVRKMCDSGFEVIERREFKRDDDNPYQHNLRYELKCR